MIGDWEKARFLLTHYPLPVAAGVQVVNKGSFVVLQEVLKLWNLAPDRDNAKK